MCFSKISTPQYKSSKIIYINLDHGNLYRNLTWDILGYPFGHRLQVTSPPAAPLPSPAAPSPAPVPPAALLGAAPAPRPRRPAPQHRRPRRAALKRCLSEAMGDLEFKKGENYPNRVKFR